MLTALALAAYLVQPGDTLSGIAASHSVSLAAVESANSQLSNPNMIYAGQTRRDPDDVVGGAGIGRGAGVGHPAQLHHLAEQQQRSSQSASIRRLAVEHREHRYPGQLQRLCWLLVEQSV